MRFESTHLLACAALAPERLARHELFDATGLAKSLWIERIGRVADDTQGMIDELMVLDTHESADLPPFSR